jgi:hypothetical protein
MAQITINIAQTIEDSDLWDFLVGGGIEYGGTAWFRGYKKMEDDWDTVGKFGVYYVTEETIDEDNEKVKMKTITIADGIKALTEILSGKFYHCGERITADVDNWDACVQDLLLQTIIYGEEKFA